MASLSRLIFRNSFFGLVRGQVVCRQMSGQSFKTDLHTDNLYPGSNLKDRFSVKKAIPSDHPSGFNGVINIDELQISYATTDANGAATKVDVRFHLDSATWLSDDVKKTLNVKLKNELTKDGFLVVKSDRTRSQLLNQADAVQKLRHAIWAALEPSYKTYLLRTQLQELSEEQKRKNHLKAARERVRERKPKDE